VPFLVTPDDSVAFAAIDFVKQSGWSKIAFLYSDELYGKGLHDACRDYAKDAATEFGPKGLGWLSVPIPPDPILQSEVTQVETAITTIRESDRLVVFFAGLGTVLPIVLEKALKHGMIGNTSGYTWIGFDTWQRRSVTNASIEAMSGSIRLMASGCPGGPSGNAAIKKIQASNPAALSAKYGGSGMPTTYAELGGIDCRAGFSYDAVWLAALSFSTINTTETSSDRSSCVAAAAVAEETALIQGSQFWQALLQTSFTGGSGAVSLASNGDRASASISIENLRDDNVITYVGDLTEGVAAPIDFTNIIWADGTTQLPRDDSVGCPPRYSNLFRPGSVNHETVRECYTCSVGRFAELDATMCAVCPDGKYNQRTGSSDCQECSTIQDSAEQCETCRAGQYRRSKHCIDCDRNKFSDTNNVGLCKECPLGKYQLDKGSGYCSEVRSGSMLVQSRSASGSEEVVFEELRCPAVGVDCDSGSLKYTGSVWHDPSIQVPNCTDGNSTSCSPFKKSPGVCVCTKMYTCVNNGCPDKDATEMACKPGYSGPLCALCSKGYFKSVRDCARCERVRIGELVVCVLGVLMLIALLLLLARKYNRYIDRGAAFSRECCIGYT
jgi:hypothetical protein